MEAELRGDRKLVGIPVTLGNGEEWIIPSLPLNDEGEKIAVMMDNIAEKAESDQKLVDQMKDFFAAMYTVLKVNYPGIGEEEARSVGLFQMAMFADFAKALAGGKQELKNA